MTLPDWPHECLVRERGGRAASCRTTLESIAASACDTPGASNAYNRPG